MRHIFIAAVLAVLAMTCVAVPRARAEYIFLGWDDCNAAGASTARTFACDANTGSDAVVVSFSPPWSATQWAGLDAMIDVMTAQDSSIPDYWAFLNSGACRQTSLSSSIDFTGMTGCVDYWQHDATGGMSWYVLDAFGQPWRSRLRIAVAMPPLTYRALSPDSQYYAMRLTITRDKSTGAGACAGCSQPVCLAATELSLYMPPNQNPYPFLLYPNDVSVVSWQSTVPNCPAAVPVKRSTWGSLKAQYR